jgi:hypothetical protein
LDFESEDEHSTMEQTMLCKGQAMASRIASKRATLLVFP